MEFGRFKAEQLESLAADEQRRVEIRCATSPQDRYVLGGPGWVSRRLRDGYQKRVTPKLLLFAPCEKAIIGADGSVSLISVLQGLDFAQVRPVSEELVGKPVSAPFTWSIVAIWSFEMPLPEDRTFEQKLNLLSPSDDILLDNVMAFIFPSGSRTHALTIGILGFPMKEAGKHLVKLWIREPGAEWVESAKHPVYVSF